MKIQRLILFLVLVSALACSPKGTVAKKVKARSVTTVTVTITGLVTLLDNPEPAEEGKLQPMTLYILNARSAAHAHVPLLMYDRKYDAGGPLDQRQTLSQNTSNYFHLIGEQLTFRGSEDDPLEYEDDPVTCATPDMDSIRWIPRLSQIATDLPGGPPDYDDLDIRYLFHTPDDARVAAFTDLSHGRLEVKLAHRLVWAFETAPNAGDATHRQATAQKVKWTFTIPEDFLIIDTRRFDPIGSLKRPLLRLNAVDGKIELTLGNVIADDIRVLANRNIVKPAEEEDPHFKKYYDVLEDQQVAKRIPILYGICQGGLERKGDTDEVRCWMKQFATLKNAPDCGFETVGTAGGINCIPNHAP